MKEPDLVHNNANYPILNDCQFRLFEMSFIKCGFFPARLITIPNKSRYYSVQLETIMLKFPIKDLDGGGSSIIHFIRQKLVYTQKSTSLACLEPSQKFSVGGWWVVLKATLVFSFGPNWNLSSDLNQAEQQESI